MFARARRRPAAACAISLWCGAVACGATACGARTELGRTSGAGGAATSSSSASSASSAASTASSSSSGDAGGCGGTPSTPSVVIATPSPGATTGVSLASASDGTATVAFGFTSFSAPTPSVAALLATTFEPWGAWPTAPVAPSHVVAPNGGASFAAARGSSTPLAFAFETLPAPPGGIGYAETFPTSDNTLVDLVDANDGRVRFLASGAGSALLGTERGAMGGHAFDLAGTLIKELPEGPYFQGLHLGCASTPTAADAISDAAGFIVALASGVPFGAFGCTGAGPATQIQLGRVSDTGTLGPGGTVGQMLPAGNEAAAVPWLRLAAGDGGGPWLFWYGSQIHGEDAPPPALQLTAFDASLEPSNTVQVSGTVANPTGDAPYATGFAIARVGQRLVVAWLNDPSVGADLPPDLVVEVLDEGGQAVLVMKVPPEGVVDAPLSLLASPNGDAALLGWSVATGDGKSPGQVRVTRVCVSQP